MKTSDATFSYDVYDTSGKKISEGTLKSSITKPEEYKNLISQAVRVYKENARERNASTKTRGEVVGSTRKIYKQKGTGRARHGDIKAPIFVGGGIVFGPRPFTKKLSLSKKTAQKAFLVACLDKIKNKELVVIEGLNKLQAKTKLFNEMIKKIFPDKKNILFINQGEDAVIRAGRNIEKVTLSPVSTVNTYDVLKHSVIAVQKESIDSLFKRLHIENSESTAKKTSRRTVK